MDLDNYVGFGSATKSYLTFSEPFPDGANVLYDLDVPVNASGRVQGFEIAYQQAINENFGFSANYTYADGEQTSLVPPSGDDRLFGTSENTYNLGAYFETERFNARVNYTFRSDVLQRPRPQHGLLAGRHRVTGGVARDTSSTRTSRSPWTARTSTTRRSSTSRATRISRARSTRTARSTT